MNNKKKYRVYKKGGAPCYECGGGIPHMDNGGSALKNASQQAISNGQPDSWYTQPIADFNRGFMDMMPNGNTLDNFSLGVASPFLNEGQLRAYYEAINAQPHYVPRKAEGGTAPQNASIGSKGNERTDLIRNFATAQNMNAFLTNEKQRVIDGLQNHFKSGGFFDPNMFHQVDYMDAIENKQKGFKKDWKTLINTVQDVNAQQNAQRDWMNQQQQQQQQPANKYQVDFSNMSSNTFDANQSSPADMQYSNAPEGTTWGQDPTTGYDASFAPGYNPYMEEAMAYGGESLRQFYPGGEDKGYGLNYGRSSSGFGLNSSQPQFNIPNFNGMNIPNFNGVQNNPIYAPGQLYNPNVGDISAEDRLAIQQRYQSEKPWYNDFGNKAEAFMTGNDYVPPAAPGPSPGLGGPGYIPPGQDMVSMLAQGYVQNPFTRQWMPPTNDPTTSNVVTPPPTSSGGRGSGTISDAPVIANDEVVVEEGKGKKEETSGDRGNTEEGDDKKKSSTSGYDYYNQQYNQPQYGYPIGRYKEKGTRIDPVTGKKTRYKKKYNVGVNPASFYGRGAPRVIKNYYDVYNINPRTGRPNTPKQGVPRGGEDMQRVQPINPSFPQVDNRGLQIPPGGFRGVNPESSGSSYYIDGQRVPGGFNSSSQAVPFGPPAGYGFMDDDPNFTDRWGSTGAFRKDKRKVKRADRQDKREYIRTTKADDRIDEELQQRGAYAYGGNLPKAQWGDFTDAMPNEGFGSGQNDYEFGNNYDHSFGQGPPMTNNSPYAQVKTKLKNNSGYGFGDAVSDFAVPAGHWLAGMFEGMNTTNEDQLANLKNADALAEANQGRNYGKGTVEQGYKDPSLMTQGMFGKYGMNVPNPMYMEGGDVDDESVEGWLDDDEIAEILRMGGTINYL